MNFKLNKKLSNNLAILGVLWLPAVLLIVPGWGFVSLFTPYVLVVLLPLLLLLANRQVKSGVIPKPVAYMQILFFVLWFLLGFFLVNSGADTSGSMFTYLFSSLADHSSLMAISRQATMVVFVVAAVVLAATVYQGFRISGRPGNK